MRRLVTILVCALVASCGQQGPQNTGVYMLLDTSGTYREELVKAEQIIRYTLSRLGETDTFAVARIDTGSFSEKDIVAKASFDDHMTSARVAVIGPRVARMTSGRAHSALPSRASRSPSHQPRRIPGAAAAAYR